MSLSFEWDEGKAKENLKKHRVGFDEATTIFTDPYSITFLTLTTHGMSNGILTSEVPTRAARW